MSPRSQKRYIRAMSLPTLGEMSAVFVRIGSFTFGGGTSTVAALERELVDKRDWLERSRFRLAYALSRITPGTSVLATCTAVGWSLRGWSGAIAALLAASVPCALIAAFITYLYEMWTSNVVALAALHGATAAAVGIVGAASWQLLRPYLSSATWIRTAVLVGGSVLLSNLSVPPLRVLLAAIVVGLVWREKETA